MLSRCRCGPDPCTATAHSSCACDNGGLRPTSPEPDVEQHAAPPMVPPMALSGAAVKSDPHQAAAWAASAASAGAAEVGAEEEESTGA